MSFLRVLIAGAVLAAGIFATHFRPSPASRRDVEALRDFPVSISTWHSAELPFSAEDVKAIGVDDYTNREYLGASRPVELYIGYYKQQSYGDAIHSPKNCLPGEGWEPVRSAQLQIGSPDNPVWVNEYIVEKGSSQAVVLYWYQTHRRVIASEYLAKFWLVADGVRNRSTDGALIRIWTTAADGENRALARAKDFAQTIYPQVSEFLPK